MHARESSAVSCRPRSQECRIASRPGDDHEGSFLLEHISFLLHRVLLHDSFVSVHFRTRIDDFMVIPSHLSLTHF